jgi:RNA polymerase sigma factor (sigma-70 family)
MGWLAGSRVRRRPPPVRSHTAPICDVYRSVKKKLPPFQQLLEAHQRDVLGFLIASVGPNDAEDCFQETFLAALRAYPKLEDDRNLRGWLLTIAHRKAIDHHRARGRRAAPVGDPPEVADRRSDPQQRDIGIWRSVAALPSKQRSAVALRFAADLSHREIAAAIGISEEAARRNVHEGVKRLRLELT